MRPIKYVKNLLNKVLTKPESKSQPMSQVGTGVNWGKAKHVQKDEVEPTNTSVRDVWLCTEPISPLLPGHVAMPHFLVVLGGHYGRITKPMEYGWDWSETLPGLTSKNLHLQIFMCFSFQSNLGSCLLKMTELAKVEGMLGEELSTN